MSLGLGNLIFAVSAAIQGERSPISQPGGRLGRQESCLTPYLNLLLQ